MAFKADRDVGSDEPGVKFPWQRAQEVLGSRFIHSYIEEAFSKAKPEDLETSLDSLVDQLADAETDEEKRQICENWYKQYGIKANLA